MRVSNYANNITIAVFFSLGYNVVKEGFGVIPWFFRKYVMFYWVFWSPSVFYHCTPPIT